MLADTSVTDAISDARAHTQAAIGRQRSGGPGTGRLLRPLRAAALQFDAGEAAAAAAARHGQWHANTLKHLATFGSQGVGTQTNANATAAAAAAGPAAAVAAAAAAAVAAGTAVDTAVALIERDDALLLKV
jgi:hypothetical protein